MIWLFERRDETLELKAHYSEPAQSYEIVRRLADGTSTIESFKTEAGFRARLSEIHQELESDRWLTRGPSLIDGAWKV